MASRLLAQVLVAVAAPVTRAFISAYQQALVNASKQGATSAANVARSSMRSGGMTVEEACKILQVEQHATEQEIAKRFDKLHEMNDPKKGGSFYLQSKIYRAKERLDQERTDGGQ
eukprot:Rmarinus@m.22030